MMVSPWTHTTKLDCAAQQDLMLHFYDECPYSLEEQEERLQAARALAKAGIPCLVHLEDALAFIHLVPTALFALHLVVADHDVDRSTQAITSALPYHVHTGVVDQYCESILRDPAQTRMYTTSTYLWLRRWWTNQCWFLFIHKHALMSMSGTTPARFLSPRFLIQSASPLGLHFSIRSSRTI